MPAKGSGDRPEPAKSSRDRPDPSALRRAEEPQRGPQPIEKPSPIPVSAGDVGHIADLVLNPSREKMREMTIVTRTQGRLFPQLDVISMLARFCVSVCEYRRDEHFFKRDHPGERFAAPIPEYPDLLDEHMYRTAQWQKSIDGRNLSKGVDILLADLETRGSEEEDHGSVDPWKE